MIKDDEKEKKLLVSAMKYNFDEQLEMPKIFNGDLKKKEKLSIESSNMILPEKINAKPNFVSDDIWSDTQKKFPWLYHLGNKYLCHYCEEASKKSPTFKTSNWSCNDSFQLMTESPKGSTSALVRFKRHGSTPNHCLAKDIINELTSCGNWQNLKIKYSWLEGDMNNTRCSICEYAYKIHKSSMIVTIWTCPELKNRQSPTHFSIEHRLDRHEKCKTHLHAINLGLKPGDNSSPPTRNSLARALSPISHPSSQSRTPKARLLSSDHISQPVSTLTVSPPDTVKRSRKSAPMKSCKPSDIILPLSISSQQFGTLKSRFPFLACHDETTFKCQLCQEDNGDIKFDRHSSSPVISKRIMTHLRSDIHNKSINDEKNHTDRKSRSTRLQLGVAPKLDYKRLSSSSEKAKTDVNNVTEKSEGKSNFSCPQCKSQFTHNVSIVEHISLCDYQSTEIVREMACPCNPVLHKFNTINKLDLHVAQDHPDQSLFSCYICSDRCCRLLALYEHMLVHHLIDWDPFDAFEPHRAPLLSFRCDFCLECFATNKELINHYHESACKRYMQPTVVIEQMLISPEEPLPDKVEIVQLITDIDNTPYKEKSPQKQHRKSLFSQKLEEIGVINNCEEDQMDLKERPIEDSCEGTVKIDIENNSGKEEIIPTKINIENQSENIKSPEETSEICDEIFEVPDHECIKVLSKSVEESTEIEDFEKPRTVVKRNRSKNPIDKLKENTVYANTPLATEKRIRVPSEKLKSDYLSYEPESQTKRVRLPSQRVRESVSSPPNSTEKRKRGRISSAKLYAEEEHNDDLVISIGNTRVPLHKFEEISDSEEMRLWKSAFISDKHVKVEIARLTNSDISQLIPTSSSSDDVAEEVKVKRRKYKKSDFLNKVHKTSKSMKRSIKFGNRLKHSFGNKAKGVTQKRVAPATKSVRIKTKSEEIDHPDIRKSISTIGKHKSSTNTIEIEDLTPSFDLSKSSKKPVIIQSQLSPPSKSMVNIIPEDELIPAELSFMDRMKKIRQLKKIRTEQQREQMMAVDKTVAEINEKALVDESLHSKSDKIQKLINSEQYSMSDLESILHTRSKKRKHADIDFHESPKKITKPTIPLPTKVDVIACNVCQLTFRSLRARDKHVTMDHRGSKIFKCNVCSKSRTTHFGLRKHAMKCHIDNFSFAVGGQDGGNMESSFACTICTQQFMNKAGLNRHIAGSHKQLDHSVETASIGTVVPPPVVDQFLKRLMEADPAIGGDPCSLCSEEMDNQYEMAIHIVEHDREKESDSQAPVQFACPKCCRLFFGQEGKAHLKDHYNIVHLEKPLPSCDDCGAEFPSTWCYYEHHRASIGTTGCSSGTALDPYDRFNAETRLAFVCSRCQTLVAGREARARFEEHQNQCTLDDDGDGDGCEEVAIVGEDSQ